MALHFLFPVENFTPIKLNLMYAWLVNLLFHLINTIIFYFKEYRSSLAGSGRTEERPGTRRITTHQSQVNPLPVQQPECTVCPGDANHSEANRFIEEFSKVYRYILHNHENELVPLKTELHYINPISSCCKRFGDGLQVSIDIPEATYSDRLIIPTAIQMLIENAIKHNVVSRNRPLQISLHANGNNSIVITNNQVKQSTEPSTGIGLRNIMKRYELVSDREVGIMKNESGFTVTLPLINPN